MLIVLARATDEQVTMHMRERRLWFRGIQLRSSKRIFGDGYARSRRRPTAHKQHSSGCPKVA